MKSKAVSTWMKSIFINILFHRFSKRYELPLLIQSVVMNITMFLMIHLCVKVRRNNAIMRARERVFSGEWYLWGFKLWLFAQRIVKVIKPWKHYPFDNLHTKKFLHLDRFCSAFDASEKRKSLWQIKNLFSISFSLFPHSITLFFFKTCYWRGKFYYPALLPCF